MDIVYATRTAVAGHTTIVEGTHWPADDPLVKAYPDLFTDNPRFGLMFTTPPTEEAAPAEPPVEQATKAPGEKRTTRRA